MIDWHSHILHGIDDGSKNLDESLKLVAILKQQGVETIIATPHFIANNNTVEQFIKKRNNAYDELIEKLPTESPNILLGAEIEYYSGISRLEGLERLKTEKGNILLLEMPFGCWTEYTLRELQELSSNSNFTVVLAHIERYLNFQNIRSVKRLLDSGILMQANASFFIGRFTRRKAFSLLTKGFIHFIGSDCHNLNTRPPKLDKAFWEIERRLGKNFISQINRYSNEVLEY